MTMPGNNSNIAMPGNSKWTAFYVRLISAGMMDDFIALLKEDAMTRSRLACQVGQSDDIRRDALADVRFCLSKSDEAAEALVAVRERANSRAAAGFQEGGASLA